jgi:uncharacterized protein (TIGR03435 family)
LPVPGALQDEITMTTPLDAVLAAGNSFAGMMLVKATVTLVLAFLAIRVAGRSRAAVRHFILAAAFSVLLVLPVASLALSAFDLELTIEAPRVVQSDTATLVGPAVPAAAGARAGAGLAAAPEAPGRPAIPAAVRLMAVWAVGALVVWAPIVIGVRHTRRVCRSGVPWVNGSALVRALASDRGIDRRIGVLLHESIPGPVTCGCVRPLILLPIDATEWDERDVRRAILHELEHVRRGDWIVQCLVRATCGLYWWHPLAWLASRKLALEAERACDDAVLSESEPTAYADQLVTLAQRLSASSCQRLLAMANRGELSARVNAVLDAGQRRGPAGMRFVMASGVAAALLLATLSPFHVVAAMQAPAPANAAATFEVASVRPSSEPFGMMGGDCRGADGGGTDTGGGGALAGMAKAAGIAPTPPGRCRFTRLTLKQLIAYAYDIPPADVDRLVLGGPGWIDGDRFDVEARSEALVPVAQMRLMLRHMLVERFGLRAHDEPREMPGYALVAATGGAKVRAATGNEPGGGFRSINGGPLTASKATMPMLAAFLARRLGRPVVDRTMLTGTYDFTLSWTPGDDETPRFGITLPAEIREKLQSNADRSGTSLYTALQEQLGLRLVAERVTGQVLVVDAAERPSPN